MSNIKNLYKQLLFFILLTSCLSNNLKEDDIFSYKKDLNLTKQEIQWLETKEYIKVGNLSSFAPFNFIDSNTPTGYSVEYMKIVGKILNKEIRFVNDTWANQISMLKAGELDLIPHLAINEERKKYLDFTNFEHIVYPIGFAVKKGEIIESMEDLKDKKIAVVKQTFLHTYFKKNFPSQPLYLSDNTEDALWALLNDKADVLVGNVPSLNYYINKNWIVNLKIINIKDSGLTDKISLPMGITKGNNILKSILEKVNLYIPLDTKKNLKVEWLIETKVDEEKSLLTQKEKEFIKKHKNIKFLVRPSRPPFEFDENGLARGIAVDYIKLICQKMGIEAEFIIKKQSLKDTLEELPKQEREYDTILFLVKNQERAKKVEFGIPYLSYPMMIITNVNGSYIGKTSDLNGKKVALEKGYLSNTWIERDYPDIKIVPAKTTIDALTMVEKGEVDAYIGNMAVANYMSVNGGLRNIRISAPSDYGSIEYSFVAPKNLKELVSILSKGF
jgi:ABC-type amino acid transport substrate-binding protein